MQGILDRLNATETQPHPLRSLPALGHLDAAGVQSTLNTPRGSPLRADGARSSAVRVQGEATDPQPVSAAGSDQVTADALVNALRSINNSVRSNQLYYISNFDPNLHDIEVWCKEVDKAKVTSNWNDN